MHVFVGQELLYEPVSKQGAARTANGWYLVKGEPVRVTSLDRLVSHGELEVECTRLRGVRATIKEEDTWIELGNGEKVQVVGMPLRYATILTVYSAQVCTRRSAPQEVQQLSCVCAVHRVASSTRCTCTRSASRARRISCTPQ